MKTRILALLDKLVCREEASHNPNQARIAEKLHRDMVSAETIRNAKRMPLPSEVVNEMVVLEEMTGHETLSDFTGRLSAR